MLSLSRASYSLFVPILLIIIAAPIQCMIMCTNVMAKEQISTNATTSRPQTTIPQGTLRGVNMATYRNRPIFGFMGIPFAEPPVGNLRFRTPLPPKPWNGTFDASSITDPCPQLDGENMIGNEDCLHLNVYTPKLPASGNSTLLPVMVFIFGGVFRSGSNSPADYGPDFLLDKDVLLVVPNHRLGALGYLSTGDEVSPGNYGLKDIVQALRWVQDNIHYFGGDSNQVTLFGGSSGAMSIHLLSLSKSTSGLFHKCITQSGSALSPMFHQPREVYASLAIKLGEYLGCPTNTSTVLIDCLRGLDASQLIKTNSSIFDWKMISASVWIPTSELDVEGALLIDSPINLFATGNIRNVPWMSSVVSDEGLVATIQFYEHPDSFEQFLGETQSMLPFLSEYRNSVDNVTAFTAALESYYLNDLTVNKSLLLTNLTQLIGDAVFTYPAYSQIQQQSIVSTSPQYFCSFGYRGTFSHSYSFSGGSTKYRGVTHGDEIIYLFKNHNYRFGPRDYEYSDADLLMVDTMVQLWTSFAINGKPNTAGLSTNVWEPYSSKKNYLQIGNGSDTTLEVKYDFLKERMKFWDELTAVTSWRSQAHDGPKLSKTRCKGREKKSKILFSLLQRIGNVPIMRKKCVPTEGVTTSKYDVSII